MKENLIFLKGLYERNNPDEYRRMWLFSSRGSISRFAKFKLNQLNELERELGFAEMDETTLLNYKILTE